MVVVVFCFCFVFVFVFPRKGGFVGGRFDLSFPVCAFFLFFINCGSAQHASPALKARISPQWHRELRLLWPSVP